MVEASITATWWWWGTCLTGEGAFLQAKLEARVPTQPWEMPVMVSVAGGGLGGGRSCVWLSACLSSGFSWAQVSGVRVEALL